MLYVCIWCYDDDDDDDDDDDYDFFAGGGGDAIAAVLVVVVMLLLLSVSVDVLFIVHLTRFVEDEKLRRYQPRKWTRRVHLKNDMLYKQELRSNFTRDAGIDEEGSDIGEREEEAIQEKLLEEKKRIRERDDYDIKQCGENMKKKTTKKTNIQEEARGRGTQWRKLIHQP